VKSGSNVEKAILYGNQFASLQFLTLTSLHKITTLNLEYNLVSQSLHVFLTNADITHRSHNHPTIESSNSQPQSQRSQRISSHPPLLHFPHFSPTLQQ
jgi:hypothetical protein